MWKFIKKFIFKNWAVKVLCALAAICLWVYVTASQNNVGKFPGTLDIRAVNTPANLVAIYDTKQVEIKVMADPAVWQKLSNESFSASVDLYGLSAGTHQVPVSITTAVGGVQIIDRTPSQILVTLEPLISKDVPIVSRVIGNAASGKVPGSVTLSSDKARISGAKSVIDNIGQVTATISLNGESENFTRNVSLAVLDDKNEPESGITILPTEIVANVAIVKGTNIKTIGVKAKIIGAPQSNFYISNIAVTPSTIDISGVQDAVNNAKYIETLPIDVSNATTTVTRDVGFSLPDGVTLMATNPTKAHVVITLTQSVATQGYSVTNFKVTNSTFTPLSYTVQSIQVVASGSPTQLAAVSAGDFTIALDLANKQPDSDGNISIDLDTSNVITPSGISATSVTPASLKVRVK